MVNCNSIAELVSYSLDLVLLKVLLGSTCVFLSFPLSQCPRDILWSFNYFEYNYTTGLNLFGQNLVSVCMCYGHEKPPGKDVFSYYTFWMSISYRL